MIAEYTAELNEIRSETRRGLVISMGIHALVFVWLILVEKIVPEPMGITEISWVDAGEAAYADFPEIISRSAPTSAEEVAPPRPARKSDEKFARSAPLDDLAPDPQDVQAVEDRLSARLSSLQKKQTDKPTELASLAIPSPVGKPTLAGIPSGKATQGAPTGLTHGGGPGPSGPISLSRTPGPRVQRAGIAVNPAADTPTQRARPSAEDTRVRRELAGARMAGPVADRKIISYVRPDYPEWAKREAIEGSVSIYFVVLPDGRVKENVMVEKTSGFSDFDDNATRALLAWRFEPLKNSDGEQWGTIVFDYRLE